MDHDEISDESYAIACQHFDIDPDTYEYGSNPDVESMAYEEEVQRHVGAAEAAYDAWKEGDIP